jgi:hypothetical protein
VSAPPAEAWRVFPWDPDAAEGESFSVGWVPRSQGQGRFDRPGVPGGVIYLAESPVHAVAEMIQHYRGQRLNAPDLRMSGHALALARVEIPEPFGARLADLCHPAILLELRIRPDETASASRRITQPIAARVHTAGYVGLRWWSALRGEWHTLVLFRDRLGRALRLHEPETLTLSHPVVLDAARELGMTLHAGQPS